jgi:hypothetical protein
MRDLVERGELTEEQAQAMMNGTTLRPPRMKEWLWPTPAAYEDRTSVETIKKLPKDRQKMKMSNLATHVRVTEDQRLWPTPKAVNPGSRPNGKGGKVLEEEVLIASGQRIRGKTLKEQQMFQTPTAMDHLPPRNEEALKKQYMKNRQGRSEHSTLREQVIYPKPQEMWPTPTARDYKDTGNIANWKENRVRNSLPRKVYKEQSLGKLCPTFVEYLMGFPTGWTNPDISNEQLIRMNTEQKDSSS